MIIKGITRVSIDITPREVANAFSDALIFDKAKIIEHLGLRYKNSTFVDGLVESIVKEINDNERTDEYVYAMDFLVNLKNALNKYV